MIERPMKLLIVEDEENIRNLLTIILDWASLDIRIVGTASTGAEALDLMDELLPDIVLTDIEMPYMDGLVLSQRILERYNDVSVVILTAHDHFLYVQQALQAGVVDYLLKPLDRDTLEKAMRETVERIKMRRALLSRMETSYKYMRNHRQFFRDSLLGELVHKGSSDGLESILEMVGVRFGPDIRYTLALINIASNGMDSFAAQKYFMINNCRAYFEQNYDPDGRLYVFMDGLDNLALLSHDDMTDLSEICRQASNAISGNLRLLFGVSEPNQKASDLPRAYIQAQDALRLTLMSEEEAGPPPAPDRHTLEQRVPDLLLFVKSGLGKQAVPLATALLQQAGAMEEQDLNAAKVFAIGFLSRAAETLAERGIPWLTLMRQITPCYPQLLSVRSFQAVEALFTEQVISLCELTEGYQQQKVGETVSRVIQDLDENYSDNDLSLSATARKFSLNSSYLSRAFKGYTGKSFSEYLIDLRIQKALDIMERSDCKAYQLARLVGIPDPNYFAKCFKKVTGMSYMAYKSERGWK